MRGSFQTGIEDRPERLSKGAKMVSDHFHPDSLLRDSGIGAVAKSVNPVAFSEATHREAASLKAGARVCKRRDRSCRGTVLVDVPDPLRSSIPIELENGTRELIDFRDLDLL